MSIVKRGDRSSAPQPERQQRTASKEQQEHEEALRRALDEEDE
jgi:hypothetical protein